ncbi:MAG TPA: queuosine precursor transporter [Cytophagales bacterium]|nr:queuosine precursor transporter [Cytophagales bacterium]
MESTSEIGSKKKDNLYIILCSIFITNAVLAEIIGVKIFSFERTIGVSPAQIQIYKDYVLDFNLTAGVVIWPFVFIFTDVINEYFGRKGVRKISIITAVLICYVFFIVWTVTELEPAQFWLDINSKDDQGNPFNVDFAFNRVLMQGMGIMVGSVTAFLVGQLLDAWVFHRLKTITGSKMIWLRATGSTMISQFIDSFLVLFIAFYFFSNWPIEQVISVGVINYIYKVGAAILLTPLLYLAHYLIDGYLKK